MKHILAVSLFLLISLFVMAVPAKRKIQTVLQPDGTSLEVLLLGDELLHYFATTDGTPIIQLEDGFWQYAFFNEMGVLSPTGEPANNPVNTTTNARRPNRSTPLSPTRLQQLRSQRALTRTSSFLQENSYPHSGEVRALVILVEFSDRVFTPKANLSFFIGMMNQEGFLSNQATGSARDYFIDQSSGTFNPVFDVKGPVQLKHSMSYYGVNNESGFDLRPGEMVKEACESVHNNLGVDFADYDQDQDGYVDLVYIIYAGYAESQGAPASTIWPHAWDLPSAGIRLTLNGKEIGKYACSSELEGSSGSTPDGIGTFCHEYSHCLGLPDFYDTSGITSNFGMDVWSVMDAGCYLNNSRTPPNYSAFERASLNWLSFEEPTGRQSYELEAIDQSNRAFILAPSSDGDEFFILENRQRGKWDDYLPNYGLLITHVDYDQAAWNANTVNNDPMRQRYTPVPADNSLLPYSSFSYKEGLKGDIYPGTAQNQSFGPFTIPASKLYSGELLYKPITDIMVKDEVVYFEYRKNFIQPPVALNADEIGTHSFRANWNYVEGATAYQLDLYHLSNTEITAAKTPERTLQGLSGSSVIIDNLTPGNIYAYKIKALEDEIISEYSNIVGVQLENTTGILFGSEEQELVVDYTDDGLYIRSSSPVSIYGIEGSRIQTEKDARHGIRISLPAGYYLIRNEKETRKAVIP